MPHFDTTYFKPERSIGYLIKRNHRFCIDALTPALAGEGLTFTHWQALTAIHFGRATTGVELAFDLAHDKGATTRLIDTLAERGWITRTRNATDRRCFDLTLTDEGRAVARRGKERIVACWNDWMADWTTEEIEGLIAGLQRLESRLAQAAVEAR